MTVGVHTTVRVMDRTMPFGVASYCVTSSIFLTVIANKSRRTQSTNLPGTSTTVICIIFPQYMPLNAILSLSP